MSSPRIKSTPVDAPPSTPVDAPVDAPPSTREEKSREDQSREDQSRAYPQHPRNSTMTTLLERLQQNASKQSAYSLPPKRIPPAGIPAADLPPANLPLKSSVPTPTKNQIANTISKVFNLANRRPGPLAHWIVQREFAYFQFHPLPWPHILCCYAACDDYLNWKTRYRP